MSDEPLWSADELASFLGYSRVTVSKLASQQPHRIPPRVVGLHIQRWVPDVCRAWVLEQSQGLPKAKATTPPAEKRRRGRPRRVTASWHATS